VTRAARLGDGWMPIMAPDAQGEETLARLREQIKSFGRDPAKFGIEGWLRMREPTRNAGQPRRMAGAGSAPTW
jgi:alkanesulfonate monooxygenase SsuD/methylene tetrahydromethanopterin reductase-like flavin-dependent oxidoreductase (luciferase family)